MIEYFSNVFIAKKEEISAFWWYSGDIPPQRDRICNVVRTFCRTLRPVYLDEPRFFPSLSFSFSLKSSGIVRSRRQILRTKPCFYLEKISRTFLWKCRKERSVACEDKELQMRERCVISVDLPSRCEVTSR